MIITISKCNKPIYFDKEISGFKTITLKSATLFNSFYNVFKYLPEERIIEDNDSVPKWYNLQLKEGFYSNESLIENIYTKIKNKGGDVGDLKIYVDNAGQVCINNKTVYQFRLLNDHCWGFKDKWIAQNIPYTFNTKSYKFNFFCIHCDILDTCDNYLDEKQSDILEMLPVIESNKFASKHVYNDNFTPKIIHSRFNKIKIDIKDENGNNIDFHDYPILLKFELK